MKNKLKNVYIVITFGILFIKCIDLKYEYHDLRVSIANGDASAYFPSITYNPNDNSFEVSWFTENYQIYAQKVSDEPNLLGYNILFEEIYGQYPAISYISSYDLYVIAYWRSPYELSVSFLKLSSNYYQIVKTFTGFSGILVNTNAPYKVVSSQAPSIAIEGSIVAIGYIGSPSEIKISIFEVGYDSNQNLDVHFHQTINIPVTGILSSQPSISLRNGELSYAFNTQGSTLVSMSQDNYVVIFQASTSSSKTILLPSNLTLNPPGQTLCLNGVITGFPIHYIGMQCRNDQSMYKIFVVKHQNENFKYWSLPYDVGQMINPQLAMGQNKLALVWQDSRDYKYRVISGYQIYLATIDITQ